MLFSKWIKNRMQQHVVFPVQWFIMRNTLWIAFCLKSKYQNVIFLFFLLFVFILCLDLFCLVENFRIFTIHHPSHMYFYSYFFYLEIIVDSSRDDLSEESRMARLLHLLCNVFIWWYIELEVSIYILYWTAGLNPLSTVPNVCFYCYWYCL